MSDNSRIEEMINKIKAVDMSDKNAHRLELKTMFTPPEVRLLTRKLLNLRFDLFEEMLSHPNLKLLPKMCTSYISNPQSIAKMHILIQDLKDAYISGQNHPLNFFRAGLIKNKYVEEDDQVIIMFFCNFDTANTNWMSQSKLFKLINFQYDHEKIRMDGKMITLVDSTICNNKITGEYLDKFIEMVYYRDSAKWNMDELCFTISNRIDYVVPKITASSMELVLDMISTLISESKNTYLVNQHPMTKKKLDRLSKTQIKLKMAIMKELRSRNDTDSVLTRILI